MAFLASAAERLARYLSLVKFHHTVFALPFALIAYFAATGGRIQAWNLGLMLVAMVSARTAAMSFNRLVDRHLDAANPRTARRELVTGAVRVREAAWLLLIAILLFVVAAYLLNPLAFALSPVALAILLGYSYTKRFTSLSHFILGLALGIAPLGAWIAATAEIALPPIILGFGVVLWVAGFDIIYACQDISYDSVAGLRSLVVLLGLRNALGLSTLLHILCVMIFTLFALMVGAGLPFYAGLLIVALSFIYQHSIVSPRDLSRVNTAFFAMNGFVGLILLVFFLIDVYM